MNPDDAQKQLQARANQMSAVYELHGREGLKDYSINDIGLIGMAKTHELHQVSAKLERNPENEADALHKEKLRSELEEISEAMKERNRGRER